MVSTVFNGLNAGTFRLILFLISSILIAGYSIVVAAEGTATARLDGRNCTIIFSSSCLKENGIEGVNHGGEGLVHLNRVWGTSEI
jgi:hypothetical protein